MTLNQQRRALRAGLIHVILIPINERTSRPLRFIMLCKYPYLPYVFGQTGLDPDETPLNAASHQGLHCLPNTQYRVVTCICNCSNFRTSAVMN